MTAPPSLIADHTRVTIHTISDWQVRTGTGVPGVWNSTVVRDVDGMPYVPGTTLTGVLRDATLTVARALDNGADAGPWQRWHRYLFGDAGDREGPRVGRWLSPAAAALSAARVTAGLRQKVLADRFLPKVITFAAVGLKIDRDTGRAAEDHLYFAERARGGLPLQAELQTTLPDTEPGQIAVTALLVLGAAWCESLGGHRRRGAGRVTVRIGDHDPAIWARWLAETGFALPEAIPNLVPREHPADLAVSRPTSKPEWQRLDLTITLRSPVRVQRQVVGNSAFGHDHLPGSLLLAWLSQVWGGELVREGVASESLLVRHGYPEVHGERGLPVPLSLHREKGTNCLRVGPPGEWKQVRDRWTRTEAVDRQVVLQRPALQWRMHNTVDRATQRPNGGAGLYSVEVIPAGRVLRGRVLVNQDLASRLTDRHGEQWWQRLCGTTRLGARRRGEYGEAIVDATLSDVVLPDPPDGKFTLLAVSDLLVRGRGLRYTADTRDLESELERRLGVAVTVETVAARTARRDTWHRTWQLPRESLVGLAAGTVVDVTPTGKIDPERWRRFLLEGVGDRRVEGFGEIAVNPPLLQTAKTAVDVDPDDTPRKPTVAGELDEHHKAVLAWLRVVAGRERLPHVVAELRSADGYRSLRKAMLGLSASQRGQWLAVAAEAALRDDPARLREYVARWRKAGSDRRRPQRKAAEQIRDVESFLHRELLKHQMDPTDNRLLATATLVLINDVIDQIRRNPEGGR